ncbi:unnamed protein product [Cylicocyclus nassatus]|uniref:Uncharacterized protein n=1 Tax=Cylicocyclus nassatus TaxID=53992 RepID=A0AA36DSS8_CYLNA|nr:unnamed protein product [Cylicocyclus nassatus]
MTEIELPDAPEEQRSAIGKAVDRLRSLNKIVLIVIAVVTAALLGLAIAAVVFLMEE